MTQTWTVAAVAAALTVGLFVGAGCRDVPAPQPQPIPPCPCPTPAPDPAPAKLIVVTQPNCPHCVKLEAEWVRGYGLPHEYVKNSAEVARRWKIEGTPTLILLDGQGREMRRQLGYKPKDELERWLRGTP